MLPVRAASTRSNHSRSTTALSISGLGRGWQRRAGGGRRPSSCVQFRQLRLEAFFNWGPAQLRQCGGLFRFRVSETNRHAACVIRLQYDGDAFCSAFVGLRSCACDYVNVWFGKQIFLRYTTKMKSIDTILFRQI
jgi:hypothetical protein